MKLRLSILAAGLLAGCATQTPDRTGPIPDGAEDTCNAAAYANLVGQDAVAALQIPEPKRQYRLGDPVTMDYRAERLNVVLNDTDTITAITCG